MGNINELIKSAGDSGFSGCAEIKTEQIVFNAEFRKLCEVNTCRCYGKNYMCPPHIGTAGECIEKIKKYRGGLLVQSIICLEDSFDYEGMTAGQELHERRLRTMAELLQNSREYFFLSAGACSLCPECAVSDNEPCRYPESAYSTLEAHCIDVCKTITNAGLKYNNGEATVSYVGLILY